MNVHELIQSLREHPEHYLEHANAEFLGAFFHGYLGVEVSLLPAWHAATDTFPGSPDVGLCRRAYLAFEDETEAMMRVLQALEDALPRGPLPPVSGPEAHRSFPSILLEALDQKRLGLVLGEQTISWLYHTYQGHLVGTKAIAPAEAVAQRKRLQEFETWLRERDGHPHAKWHRMIRVHNEGESPRGVENFARLWREFERIEEPSPPFREFDDEIP